MSNESDQQTTPQQMIEWLETEMGIEQSRGPWTDRTREHDAQFYRLKAIRDFIVAHSQGKLWLWKNFVDGRPEFWAFDNPYPVHGGGDPMTLGEPVGYAIFKESRIGRTMTKTTAHWPVGQVEVKDCRVTYSVSSSELLLAINDIHLRALAARHGGDDGGSIMLEIEQIAEDIIDRACNESASDTEFTTDE